MKYRPADTSVSKPFWQSKTLFGIALAVVIALYPNLQEFFEESRLPTSGEWYELIGVLAAAGFAAYGRYAADTLITLPGQEVFEEEEG
ncbi:hypothetical protein [Vacuolonema iberomarrocanum]|uniref:hypothetical protein n=1 Tax=Vacuolonema iberomarrocanum TaxID=3454632 RepID=UPI0019F288A2|nr:hypothetical protein [filamentous cyanobacterium LEGE 07170]